MRHFSSYYLNPAALCVYAGLILAAYFVERDQWVFCFAVVSIFSAYAWMFNLRRTWAISEVPASNIASAAQGYIELIGKSVSLLPLKSPLRGLDCVWFRYWVYSRNANGLWQLEQYSTSQSKFGLQDGTGYCEIDPVEAEVVTSDRKVIVQNDHKYIEDVLRTGSRIYVLGELNARNDINSPVQIRKEAGELISEWKGNLVKYLLRFDLNRDGRIDMHEWELARQQAYHEVQVRHEMLAQNLIPVIASPQNDRLFLIAGTSPEELRAGYRYWAFLHFVVLCGSMVMLFAFVIGNK